MLHKHAATDGFISIRFSVIFRQKNCSSGSSFDRCHIYLWATWKRINFIELLESHLLKTAAGLKTLHFIKTILKKKPKTMEYLSANEK